MSHFLSEMSCGEVVAGSLPFPGRAFEFSSLHLFPSPPLCVRCTALLSPPGGDKRQKIDRPACHVRSKFLRHIDVFPQLCTHGVIYVKLSCDVNEVFKPHKA